MWIDAASVSTPEIHRSLDGVGRPERTVKPEKFVKVGKLKSQNGRHL